LNDVTSGNARLGCTALMAAVMGEVPHAAAAQQAPLVAPSPRPPSGFLLRELKNGGYTHETEAWGASIAADGSVRFVDHNVVIDAAKVGPFRFMSAPKPGSLTLQSWLREGSARRAPPDPWALMRAPISPYHADPRAGCLQRDPCFLVPLVDDTVTVAGRFDLTDAYMRWLGEDPYRHDKARFLAATFELRVRMVARYQAAQVRASLADLPARLEALWADPSSPPVERRHLLWSLWMEMSDLPEGVAARGIIESFIQRRLPRGSPDAFTDAELAQLGGGFGPYGR